jgi:hypothetical protein
MQMLRRALPFSGVATALLLPLALLIPANTSAQTVLLREGDLVPDTDWTITALNNTAVSGPDRMAISGTADSGVGTLISFVVDVAGDCSGTPAPCVLRFEQTIGDYEQTSFESFYGIGDAGQVAYSPSCTDTVTQTTGLDGVWLDDAVIAIELQGVPNDPLHYWSFGSRPTSTADGVIYWIGGITDTQGGSTQNRGLFMGASATPLVMGGDMIPGLANPVSTGSSGISFDYRVSRVGTHWIAEIGTDTGSSANDNSMIIDGELALADGMPLTEGTVIPVGAGGLGGESWGNFDYAGITESGTWMITGDTNAGTAVDEFIAIDGTIVHREGDTLDGEVLTGSLEGAYLNEDGDYAFIWDIVGGAGALEALYFGDQLVLTEGDPVDWDGDGNIDIDTAIDNFTGISTMTLTDRDDLGRVVVLCTADVLQPDGITILEGFIAVTMDTGPVAVGDPGSHLPVALRAVPSVGSGTASVRFDAALASGDASLEIFDVAGRRIANVFSGVVQAGAHSFVWDGTASSGAPVRSGVYWARLSTGDRSVVARITRLP